MTDRASCDFCAWQCSLGEGQTGRCGVRRNAGGQIISLTRDQAVALATDPIEKKPLYHALPATQTLSVAMFGCNFSCSFCQNARISQSEFLPESRGQPLSPRQFAEAWHQSGLPSVSFTYSEPTVWLDWLIEAAQLVKQDGGRCFMVSNGFFSAQSRQRLAGLIDGYNIDLKGDDDFYRKHCGGRLAPVLENLRALAPQSGIIVEVCTLLVEGLQSLDSLLFLGQELEAAGVQVWHLSRFFPAYRMTDRPATSHAWLETVLTAIQTQLAIPYLYPGNSKLSTDSHCPKCGKVFIRRTGNFQAQPLYDSVALAGVYAPPCPHCGQSLYLLA